MTVSVLLTPNEVSELLGVTTHTLAVWRCERRYNLPYVKTGRLVRYQEADVQNFIQERIRGKRVEANGNKIVSS